MPEARTSPSGPPAQLLSWMDDVYEQAINGLPDRVEASLTTLLQSSLLAESVGHFLGVRLLVENRLVSQAMVLNRSLVENSVFLVYMAANPDKADQLALRYWWATTNRELQLVQEGNRVHEIQSTFRRDLMMEELAAVERAAEAASIQDFRKRLPSTADMARSLGATRGVVRLGISLLSLHVHSGRTPLARRLTESPGTAGAFTPRESSPEWQTHAGVIATVSMADAAAAVAALQEWGSREALRLAAEAAGRGWPAPSC